MLSEKSFLHGHGCKVVSEKNTIFDVKIIINLKILSEAVVYKLLGFQSETCS